MNIKVKIFLIVMLNMMLSLAVNLISNTIGNLDSKLLVGVIILLMVILSGVLFFIMSSDSEEEKAFKEIYSFGAKGLRNLILDAEVSSTAKRALKEGYRSIENGDYADASNKAEHLEKMKAVEVKLNE